jgi:hybrid cluster-associated redox disulfide protein
MPGPAIALDASVDEVMQRFPATTRVFLRHRMLCMGCAVGVIHAVADAVHEHEFEDGPVLEELRASAAGVTAT